MSDTEQVAKSDNDVDLTEGGDIQSDGKPETAAPKTFEDKVVAMEDLKDEVQYSDDEYNEMMELYNKTMSEFVEGELVVGKILAITDKEVAVDIGFKSEGVIPLDEFNRPNLINVGEDLEVFLEHVEDKDGQLVLSKRKADFLRTWERILDSYNNEDTVMGICSRRIKGGIVVDLNGVDAFLPGSQIDVKPIRDFDALIGKELEFKIVKVNELRKNIVVSHRVLVEEGMKEQRQKILANLDKGQILEGSVKNITDFGVFIDLGGVDGLLHINDLSWGRVNHPSEIVSLDEKVNIQILDFNETKDRISLGLKQLQPHPWDNVKDKYQQGEVVKGKVVNISDYGAFIEIEKGVEGLIHISEMSWTQHIKHPSKLLSLGEVIDAKILNIDNESRKISLGLKQLEPDPWEGIEAKYPVDSRQKGVVRNLTNFGAFVELEEGVDGLIHISDLSWTKKIRHPGEVIAKGDEIDVMVLNIDQGNRRISLGYKQTMDNPWETLENSYTPQAATSGTIMRLIEKGVIVELPEDVDGFVPMSHLKKEGIRKPADGYKVGDKLDLVVIEFNKENKKIILSEKQTTGDTSLKQDDQEAIAEFEKEVGVAEEKPSGKKAKSKTTTSAKTKSSAAKTKTSDVSEAEAEAEAVEAKESEVSEVTDEVQEDVSTAAEEVVEDSADAEEQEDVGATAEEIVVDSADAEVQEDVNTAAEEVVEETDDAEIGENVTSGESEIPDTSAEKKKE